MVSTLNAIEGRIGLRESVRIETLRRNFPQFVESCLLLVALAGKGE